MKLYWVFLTLLVIGYTSCREKDKDLKDWYASFKKKIIEESNLIADHIDTSKKSGLHIYEVYYFKGNHMFKQDMFTTKNQKISEIFYSLDEQMLLSHEICDNGLIAFEGIFMDGHATGPSTWWHCNGKIRKQGIRYLDRFIGEVSEFDEEGKQISDTNYNHLEKIAEIKSIMNNR